MYNTFPVNVYNNMIKNKNKLHVSIHIEYYVMSYSYKFNACTCNTLIHTLYM